MCVPLRADNATVASSVPFYLPMARRSTTTSTTTAKTRRSRGQARHGMYGDELVREMRHDYGRTYSGTEQADVPEPPGHHPLGDNPLAGYDVKSKPKRPRRLKRR
jgi:hypothetical protein